MKASEFVQHLEERGITCAVRGVRGDRFVAKGASTLPAWTKQALTAHRNELTRFLVENVDQELKPKAARAELRRLGFVLVPEINEWLHPMGTEHGDAILLGLIDPAEVEREQEQAAKDINAPPRPLPRAVPVENLREVYPGRWRWSESEGVRYTDPFPRLNRA
jgi:hypothetical protein